MPETEIQQGAETEVEAPKKTKAKATTKAAPSPTYENAKTVSTTSEGLVVVDY